MSELAQEERPPGVSSNSVHDNKHAGELSTDEVNKNETVLNNSCQFKIPAHTLNRNSAHDVTVVHDVTDKESFHNM